MYVRCVRFAVLYRPMIITRGKRKDSISTLQRHGLYGESQWAKVKRRSGRLVPGTEELLISSAAARFGKPSNAAASTERLSML